MKTANLNDLAAASSMASMAASNATRAQTTPSNGFSSRLSGNVEPSMIQPSSSQGMSSIETAAQTLVMMKNDTQVESEPTNIRPRVSLATYGQSSYEPRFAAMCARINFANGHISDPDQ